MKRAQALELRRKKLALIQAWNKLALELGGSQAEENIRNLQIAGRLLEACEDKQGLFTTRVRRFLNESWRSYRRLSDLFKAWETLGDPRRDSSPTPAAKVPGEWSVGNPHTSLDRLREAWSDPRNVSAEELRQAARRTLERLRRINPDGREERAVDEAGRPSGRG